ncbi:3937_t:CDS:2, partial [Diversispora eburnea]
DRKKILYNLHSSPLARHFGLRKTIENITRKYYWPGIGADVKAYIESLAVDYFTKWSEAKAIKEATAIETAKFLYETIICQYGTPSIILSNRGTHFVNETIKLMKEEVGFRHKLSSAYHPQINELTEQFNGTLCRTLKQESTKYTPFYLVHGRKAQLSIDIEFQDQEQNLNPIENFKEFLNKRINALKGIFIDTQIINHRNI